MNERIQQLSKQAREYTEQTVHYYQGQFNGLTWEGKIKQTRDTKFAELIVRECAEVCHKMAEDSDSYVVHDGDTCAEQIKQHFGVEE